LTSDKILEFIKQLDPENDKIVRMRAAIGLGNFGEEATKAIPALINTLKNDESSKVREHAAKALGEIAKKVPETSIPQKLVDSMLDDPSESVRLIAAEALGELGEKAIQALSIVMCSEADLGVLEKTIETLGKIVETIGSEHQELPQSMITEIITVVKKHTVESLHLAAIDAILKIGEPAIKPLLKIFREEASKDVKTVIEIIFEKLAQKLGYRNKAALIRTHDY